MSESRGLLTVSVITPVYNGERYIAGAIESVLRQTHQDFEYIIVNDGSTDRTPEILEQYAARDGRIRVIHQVNIDQPATLNRALAEARNDWVAVLDADDVCMPHRLETQLRALRREPSVRVLGAYAIRIDERGREMGLMVPRPTSVSEYKEMAARGESVTLVHPSAIMHRPTILSLGGYDPDFGPAADSELWSRVADQHLIMSLPEPLLYYRSHPASMSATRFFEQRVLLRWIQARQQARRQGRPVPTLEEYREACCGTKKLHRLNHLREDWGEYLRATSRLAWRTGRRPRALLMRGAAVILDPFARSRARNRGPA
jgi:glycosyltransferase involved in cell wall biosynthesis